MNCPVCGSPDRGGAFRTKEYGAFRTKDHLIVTCARCSLQFIDPLTPAAAEVALEKMGEAFIETYILEEPSYRAYFRNKVRDLIKVAPPGCLLDVGCATGVFLDEARRAGFQEIGVDLLPSAVAYARDRLGVDARLGVPEEMGFSSGHFDAVSLFQIIEHVPDPAGLVREVARLLKPGGALLLTTPDRRGFLARLTGQRWFEYYNEEHLTYFDKRSLSRLLTDGGFAIVNLRSEFGRAFTLRYVAERLSSFYYTDRSLVSRGGRLLARLLRVGGGLTVREPWQSLYAIARRT